MGNMWSGGSGGSGGQGPNNSDTLPQTFERTRYTGPMGWWINLTAPPVPQQVMRLEQREKMRKAVLTSYSILGVFAFLIALVSNSIASAATAQAVVVMALLLFIAAVLNRAGRVRIAAYLVPSALMLLIALSVVAAPGLRPIGLPIFDLFVIPIILVSLVGNRRATWIYAIIAIAFITADYSLQPHDFVIAAGGHRFDELAYEQGIFGWWGMVNRHVALCFFAALFGWLGARSVDQAILRADRAEELAALEHQVAVQRRALEAGARQLLEAHVRIANKDFQYRIQYIEDPVLWQVGKSFNTMVSRFMRSEQAEHQLRRTEEEIRRLAKAIDDTNAGRQPIWPAPANTAADLILERIVQRNRPATSAATSASVDPWPTTPHTGALQEPQRPFDPNSGGSQGSSSPSTQGDSPWLPPGERQGW